MDLDSLLQKNPHCRQLTALHAQQHLDFSQGFLQELTEDSYQLDFEGTRMPYFGRTLEDRSTAHWGQLKIFEYEMRVLTKEVPQMALDPQNQTHVLYIGAGPGNHIHFLIQFFPYAFYDLYDPNGFCPTLKELAKTNPRVRLFDTAFDEDTLATFERLAPYLVFISDIRTGLQDTFVEDDMILQKQLVDALQPQLSLLKFRLPWNEKPSTYFDGDLYIQAFAPVTSTETRLIVKDPLKLRTYDNKAYEELLMFHNTISRSKFYYASSLETSQKLRGSLDNLDACYDCTRLQLTMTLYLRLKDQEDRLIPTVDSLLKGLAACKGRPRNARAKLEEIFPDRMGKKKGPPSRDSPRS